jgi:hypothetical protein
MTNSLKAFVIGPIGDRDAPDGSEARTSYEQAIQVFEEVIVPACTAFGVEATRADMISRAGEIPEQIFRQLRDVPVVIADLTGANPNVMYELGLRHTTGKITIQLGERGRLPFDVAAIRTIMFKRTEAGLVQARKDLSRALASTLDSGGDPVAATRIWFESSLSAAEVTSTALESEAGEETDEDTPGFLELLAEMEDGNQSLIQTMTAATTIAEDITRIYSEATSSLNEADVRGGGASARLLIANRTAEKLDEQASRMEVVAGDYERTVHRIEPGLTYLARELKANPAQLSEAPGFIPAVRGLSEASQGTVDGALAMRQNALDMGKASRTLKRVGYRLSTSFAKMAEVSREVGAWRKLVEDIPFQTDEPQQ